MAFANANVTDLIAAGIESRTGEIADNVTGNNILLSVLKKGGRIKTVSGGTQIFQELSFATNGNGGWYQGADLIPVQAQDVISAAAYGYKQYAVAVVVTLIAGSVAASERLVTTGRLPIHGPRG